MKQIINLLLLPFHLLFYIIHHLLKKCFRWLFKQDFESLNATIQNQRDSIDKKVMKIQDLEKKSTALHSRFHHILNCHATV